MDKFKLMDELDKLNINYKLLIWDPNTKLLVGGDEIESFSLNGDAIQINLAVKCGSCGQRVEEEDECCV